MAVNPTPNHPVHESAEDYLLPCGRALEDLWEPVVAGRPPADDHERTCPHCRTAREGLLALHSAARQLVDEPVAAPAGLTDRIMAAVRADIRRTAMVDLPGDHGPVAISEQAIAVVLRFAADQVSGVRARHCAVHPRPGAPPGVLDVRMSIAVRYGTGPAGQVLAAVRSAVATAAASTIGVHIGQCDLVIEDLYD